MNRPCQIALPQVACPGSDSPLLNYSAEASDQLYFYGTMYSPFPPWNPAVIGGGTFVASDCSGTTFSVASQEVADLLALANSETCGATGLTTAPDVVPIQVFNQAQSASGSCSSLAIFSITIPAGSFSKTIQDASEFAAAQIAVDDYALAYAQQRVASYDYCAACTAENAGKIGMCLDAPYSSTNLFVLSGTQQSANWSATGLPPGITLVPEKANGIIDPNGDQWVPIGGGGWLNLSNGSVQLVTPAGTLDTGAGTADLKGTPTQSGNFNFTVKAKALNGQSSSTFSGVISVLGFVNTSPLPNQDVCNGVNIPLLANGGTAPYVFSFDPVQPPPPYGLEIRNGSLIGEIPAGTYTLHLIITDSLGQGCSSPLSLTITPSELPSFTTPSPLPNAHVGTLYLQAIAVSGGCPIPSKYPPYIITVDSGSLPPYSYLLGGSLNVYLQVSPTAPGVFSFTLKAVDNAGQFVLKAYTLTIDQNLAVSGSCANNPGISASGYAPPVTTQAGWRTTAAAEKTQANAISDLITNLQALGCNCPPCSVQVDPIGPNTTITNTSATCTISVAQTGYPSIGPFVLTPGAVFNYNTTCHNNWGITPSGPHTFNLGGGVVFSNTY